MARRVRREFRGGRVVDLGAGLGLLAHVMLLLDDSSPSALVVDKSLPPSARKLHESLVEAWPRLAGRVEFVARAMDDAELGGPWMAPVPPSDEMMEFTQYAVDCCRGVRAVTLDARGPSLEARLLVGAVTQLRERLSR